MRCSLCGKKIENGTLCNECIETYKQDKAIEQDDKLLLKINRKFLPLHQLLVNFEVILLGIIMIVLSILAQNISYVVCSISFIVISLLFFLMINKRIAVGTKCLFYETKVVYTFDFGFVHRKKVLKYSEIVEITSDQRFLQARFGLGRINIFSNKSGFVFNGIMIEDVPNIKETVKKLRELIGDKI